MYKPIGERNGQGFYPSFQINVLVGQFASTESQQLWNNSHRQCPTCKGWGYRIERHGRTVIRENIGCDECGGLGKIPRE